jgi:hypothetical protein
MWCYTTACNCHAHISMICMSGSEHSAIASAQTAFLCFMSGHAEYPLHYTNWPAVMAVSGFLSKGQQQKGVSQAVARNRTRGVRPAHKTYQLVCRRGGNDLHVGVSVLGNGSDSRCWLVWMSSLDRFGGLRCSFHGFVTKMDHILAGISEELLAKALEVAVNQSHGPCEHSLW